MTRASPLPLDLEPVLAGHIIFHIRKANDLLHPAVAAGLALARESVLAACMATLLATETHASFGHSRIRQADNDQQAPIPLPLHDPCLKAAHVIHN